MPAALYAEAWQRLRRWPHTYEVDKARGQFQTDTPASVDVGPTFSAPMHQTYDLKRWRVNRGEWKTFVDAGSLSPAMFEHFSLFIRESLQEHVYLANPFHVANFVRTSDVNALTVAAT